MAVSECPACTYHIPVGNLQEGDTIKCPDCGVLLKLVRAFPPIFEEVQEG
ncbi:MAG: hypothetical protein N3G80_01560 [Candidatus Micrarchaeota archaeon]|nr:hypothetical protein [Candidatus Micrarchaeota archaeon]